MEKLLETLNVSDSVTVVPTAPDDFWDYDGLLNDMYKDISGKVKINHIFSCNSDNPLSMALDLRKSIFRNTQSMSIMFRKLGRGDLMVRRKFERTRKSI